jgi:drug/metabolite transporter (DMT)-like permease
MSSHAFGLAILILAVLIESLAQLCLKQGATSNVVKPVRPKLWLTLGVILYCLEIGFYTIALNNLDVSVAFPIGSLCFVAVALLSHFYLKEKITTIRWLGIASIVIGSALVSL